MKKILIGTHNKGKFKEIAYLVSKEYKKISPLSLNIKSPKETGKSFIANSKLKVRFFSKFVNKFYCFDSFEGLKEDWVGTSQSKGHYCMQFL